ncbi:MAG: DNA repair protein RecN [Bacteroidota bacterium]|nr:DNA repair protein RecN [Bacteroidota bacterium]
MLKSLFVQNYALIDRLEIDFHEGFSVITGETGAGKSIILGALSLILGQRADSKSIKQGENKCVIEGYFDISAYALQSYFEENDIEYDANTTILRRELMASGKSRAFINDTPASLNQLKELGARLIDIHSQHQNLLLSDNSFQLRVLDLMAGNRPLLERYGVEFQLYRKYKSELKRLTEQSLKEKEEEDYLRFQFNQLDEAKLVEGEQNELEKEQEMLNHAEDIKGNLYKICQLLSSDEGGVVQLLREAMQVAGATSKVYADGEELAQRLESNYIDLKDLAAESESMAEDIEFSPERLAFIDERLSLIYQLEQKHRVKTVEELLNIQQELDKRLSVIDNSDEELQRLTALVDNQLAVITRLAAELTEKRKAHAPQLAKELMHKVSPLGMPHAKIELAFETKKQPDENGAEGVDFLFSANKNGHLQPVAQIASGGEVSRLMLCLKALIADAKALPIIVFDEIDTGVSGEIADKMGVIMWEMSQVMQVISITHLPQIASKGKHHYKVYKEDNEHSTATRLRKLDTNDRTAEVARMLSGAELTQAALENAQELINQWKKAK